MLKISRYIALIQSRNASYWNKDWRPGPYPKTEKERIAAAKKYGMIPEDYKPFPDDGFGYGDYPMLPIKSSEARDANILWDDSNIRRNFGEPVNVDADLLTEDRWSPDVPKRISNLKMAVWLLSSVLGLTILMHFSPDVGIRTKQMPKQYPAPGVSHYTFEPLNSEEKEHAH